MNIYIPNCTVKDLIRELEKLPENTPIFVDLELFSETDNVVMYFNKNELAIEGFK